MSIAQISDALSGSNKDFFDAEVTRLSSFGDKLSDPKSAVGVYFMNITGIWSQIGFPENIIWPEKP